MVYYVAVSKRFGHGVIEDLSVKQEKYDETDAVT